MLSLRFEKEECSAGYIRVLEDMLENWGVPAALYERWKGLNDTNPTSLYIWFAATLAFSAHALLAAVG